MKRIWQMRFLDLLCVILICLCSLGIFGVTTNRDEEALIKTSVGYDVVQVLTMHEDVVEEPVLEAEPVVVEEVVPTVIPAVEPVVVETPPAPVLPENTIQIGNILSNRLMKDTTGEHFYLNHNINGEYDGIGVPYIDFRTDFTTKKTIIYSHSSMSGNGPFQVLQNYHNNYSFYQQNPYITITYEGKTYTYQIFSVYVSIANSEEDEGLEFFHHIYYNNQEWQDALDRYKAHSEYDTGVSVSSNDRIVILQTCSMDPNYYQKYYRYNLLIMGKLV